MPIKRISKAEADAAVDLLNEGGDRALAALKRVEEETGSKFLLVRNQINDALANARIRIRAHAEKETEN